MASVWIETRGTRHIVVWRDPVTGKRGSKGGFPRKKAAETFRDELKVKILRGELLSDEDRQTPLGVYAVRQWLLEDGYGRTLDGITRRLAGACDPRDRRRLVQLAELGYRYDPRATLVKQTADAVFAYGELIAPIHIGSVPAKSTVMSDPSTTSLTLIRIGPSLKPSVSA